jgi:hypothetical protein
VSGDDTARFLHELRQLRNHAGLGHAQLAARAHYPYDSIKAAEVGPSLPDLPVLSAFVRGCGGPTQEWEERWRSLTSSPPLPVPETRQTGRSDAADAGARINSAAAAGDGPDPSVILAALNRVAEEMGSPGADPVLAPPVVQPAPDLPSAAFSSPSSSFPSDFPPGAAEVGPKPAGWDPIRVSSAWPALKHTPTVAESASDAGVPGGTGSPDDGGAPWGAAVAPWAEDPADTAAAASSSAADSSVAGTGTAFTRATDGTSTSVTGASAGASNRGGPGRSSQIAIVVAALVLLCAVVVLLVTVG